MRDTGGGRSVWIDSEVLAKFRTVAMSKRSIRVWEGPVGVAVDCTDRDRTTSDISRAFEARGYELQVHESFDCTGVALRRTDQSHK
jgi:hypothetical protein